MSKKFGVWFSTIGLATMAMLHSFNGDQIGTAVYTSTILAVVFLISWFHEDND